MLGAGLVVVAAGVLIAAPAHGATPSARCRAGETELWFHVFDGADERIPGAEVILSRGERTRRVLKTDAAGAARVCVRPGEWASTLRVDGFRDVKRQLHVTGAVQHQEERVDVPKMFCGVEVIQEAVATPVIACTLTIGTPQRELLTGEPLKLMLKWQPGEEACLAPMGWPGFVEISVWRDDKPMGVYREYPTIIVMSNAPTTTTVAKGTSIVVNKYLVSGGYGVDKQHRPSFVFPTPGKYKLAIRGVQLGKVVFESNRLSFDVREPEGRDKDVFNIIARNPTLLLDGGADAEKLLDQYPDSAYLCYVKVARLRRWRNDLINRIDPHTGASVGYAKGTERWTADQGRALADAILADGEWGAFEEERLFAAASFKQTGGDPAGASQLRKLIKERFPASQSAQAANELEDETIAWSGQGTRYKDGDMVTHQGYTWVCIQAHRSQPDWPPDRVPAIWVKLVKTKDWDHPVQYRVGDKVTYQGATYTCRQAHTSQAGWQPPNTPALWSRVQ